MQLLLDYPWYYILFCLLAGAAYSFILYRKTPKQKDDTPRSWRLPLALLRFVTVAFIAFLLLAPLVKRHVNTHEKPIIVLAQDVSESVQPVDHRLWDFDSPQFDIVRDSFGG